MPADFANITPDLAWKQISGLRAKVAEIEPLRGRLAEVEAVAKRVPELEAAAALSAGLQQQLEQETRRASGLQRHLPLASAGVADPDIREAIAARYDATEGAKPEKDRTPYDAWAAGAARTDKIAGRLFPSAQAEPTGARAAVAQPDPNVGAKPDVSSGSPKISPEQYAGYIASYTARHGRQPHPDDPTVKQYREQK
jgi:hypothetical protein